MSVPFSNTHLRVPRGFADLLEGLAREVLRDQPKDIPAFAALYFRKLLQEREGSGMDPAEWTDRCQDRLYDYSFKIKPRPVDASDTSTPVTSPGATKKEEADSLENQDTEIIVPVQVSAVSSANFDILEDVPGIDTELSSVNDSDNTTALITGSDGGTASVNICAKELDDPEGGVADEDICAKELRQPGEENVNADIGAEDKRDSDEGVDNIDICSKELRHPDESTDEDKTRMDVAGIVAPADITVSDLPRGTSKLNKGFTEEAKTDVPQTGTEDGSLPNVQTQAKEEASTTTTEPEGLPLEEVAEEQSSTVEAEGEPQEKVSETADHSNQELSEGEAKDVINPESENNQEPMQKDFSPL